MTAFIEAYLERCKEIGNDFVAHYPDKPGWIAFSREKEGIIISVFDKTNGNEVPFFVAAIRREDWRMLLDLMPGENITYPTRWYSDFESTERQAKNNET